MAIGRADTRISRRLTVKNDAAHRHPVHGTRSIGTRSNVFVAGQLRVVDEGAPTVSATTTCPASCTMLSSLIWRRASPIISISCAEGVRSCQLDTFAVSSGIGDSPGAGPVSFTARGDGRVRRTALPWGRPKGVDTGLRDSATDEGYDQ